MSDGVLRLGSEHARVGVARDNNTMNDGVAARLGSERARVGIARRRSQQGSVRHILRAQQRDVLALAVRRVDVLVVALRHGHSDVAVTTAWGRRHPRERRNAGHGVARQVLVLQAHPRTHANPHAQPHTPCTIHHAHRGQGRYTRSC